MYYIWQQMQGNDTAVHVLRGQMHCNHKMKLKLQLYCLWSGYEQEYGIWTVSDNDRKLIKLDISLIYVVILWPNGWLVC